MPDQPTLPEVVEKAEQSLAKASPPEEMTRVLEAALHSVDVTPEKLMVVADLHDRLVEKQARAAFTRAFAAFQAECPVIPKSHRVTVAKKSGGTYSYNFPPIETIVGIVSPLLKKHGFAISFTTEEAQGGVTAICELGHAEGHTKTARFYAPLSGSPSMSPAQKMSGTRTYAKRQTLVDVLGLTIEADDTDASEHGDTETITEDQYANLKALCEETGAAEGKVATVYGVSNLGDLPAVNYAAAVRMLEAKRK